MELQTLLETVGVSVQQAQKTIENDGVAQFFQYFTQESEPPENIVTTVSEEGVPDNKPPKPPKKHRKRWTPKTESIYLPASNGKESQLEVPVVALVNHSNLGFDEIKIKMKINLKADAKRGVINADLDVSENGDTASEVELTFRKNVPSEGIARLNQEAVDQI